MSVMILIHWIQKRLQALEPQVGLLSHSALLGNSQAKISWGYSCLYLQTKKLTIFQYPLVLDPVYFVMSKLINLISTWTANKILVPFYKYALKAQINLLWQLYICFSERRPHPRWRNLHCSDSSSNRWLCVWNVCALHCMWLFLCDGHHFQLI